jgi:hypothetical protein
VLALEDALDEEPDWAPPPELLFDPEAPDAAAPVFPPLAVPWAPVPLVLPPEPPV